LTLAVAVDISFVPSRLVDSAVIAGPLSEYTLKMTFVPSGTFLASILNRESVEESIAISGLFRFPTGLGGRLAPATLTTRTDGALSKKMIPGVENVGGGVKLPVKSS